MENPYNNIQVLHLLDKYKKHLFVIAVLASVISSVLTSPMFIKPRYKSNAVIYPSNITPYSSESQTEQMLEIFKSTSIRDTLAKKFDLYKRYKIDESSNQKKTSLSKIYDERVNIDKTDYEAVSISISDEDPVIAKRMLDSLIAEGDRLLKKLHRDKQKEVVESFEKSRDLMRTKMDSLQIKVDSMRTKYGILDFGIQTKEIYRSYYKAISSGNKGVDEMRKMIEVLKTHGYNYDFTYQESNLMRDLYIRWEDEYFKALRDYDRNISYINVVTSPDVPDKKSYPVRWVIVLSSVLATFGMSLLLLAFYDARQKKSV